MTTPYPPIEDYAFIGDCHTAALVSSSGSIDWCCFPQFASGSVFARLLDWERGGFCSLWPVEAETQSARRYLDDTLVLATTFDAVGGEAVVYDCFTVHEGGSRAPYRELLRIVEGVRGRMTFDLQIAPRFDYGEVAPWLRHVRERVYSAVGGNDALIVTTDADLEIVDLHDLRGRFEVHAGSRVRISIKYCEPEIVDEHLPERADDEELDRHFDETVAWWRRWRAKLRLDGPYGPEAIRSALVLKALIHAPTGAVVAAPTTSLPETPGGVRNWDYRYSWVRDSQFTVRTLTELGADDEADGFRRFIERSAGGSADSLQIMYGVGGERRLPELELDLAGYRGATPVRVGNAASRQLQLDVYGYLMDLAWRWHERGRSPDDDYWRFLLSVVDLAVERWQEPDCGIWEMRGRAQHFVHSKVMCWSAVHRGLQLADACLREAPKRRWQHARRELHEAIHERGVDRDRGVFVQAFDSTELDAALLLVPTTDFVAWDDPIMRATTDAIAADLVEDGLVRRYRANDHLRGREGAFVPATFWLAECLARQGRTTEAREVFDAAVATGSDLGLFSEEYDTRHRCQLGNYPQGLSHLSHIAAAVALTERLPG